MLAAILVFAVLAYLAGLFYFGALCAAAFIIGGGHASSRTILWATAQLLLWPAAYPYHYLKYRGKEPEP